VYHFELRKFPHTVSRFNQSEQQLLALVVPWVREAWVELDERKWNVHETKLTVLEGPELSLPELAMNRGWRNALRRSADVTQRVLAAARAAGPPAQTAATGELDLLADSLALEVFGLLDAGPAPLTRVWQLAHGRLDGGSPAESLALAELAVRSLLGRGLVVVGPADAGRGGGDSGGDAHEGGGAGAGARADLEATLNDIDSWISSGGEAVTIARKA
jgi:hypothetical protein